MLDFHATELQRSVSAEGMGVISQSKSLSHAQMLRGEVGRGKDCSALCLFSPPTFVSCLLSIFSNMPAPYLLLSNPPHGEIDVSLIAGSFGFTAAEARMRANFPAPEIWFADTDLDALKRTGGALMKGGAKVRIIKGSMLSAIPPTDHMTSFAFNPDGFAVQLRSDSTFSAAYDARLIIVSSRPKANPKIAIERPKPQLDHSSSPKLKGRSSVGGIITTDPNDDATARVDGYSGEIDPWFLDLYFIVQSKVRRLRARTGKVDYSGLGTDLKPVAKQNHAEFLNRITAQFTRVAVDERLVDVPPPRPSMISGKGLPVILESIDPALKNVKMEDLQSRLVFLSLL